MEKWKLPLAADSFTFLDRLKASWFILNRNNQLTMGPKVAELEKEMSRYAGANALAVSSGSAANQLLFELYRQKNPEKFKNTLVIVPAVTWISNISPATMLGYKIQFCDINLRDFSFDYEQLERIIKDNLDKNIIIWATALIGFCPDFTSLKKLSERYGTELFCDCAENMFSNFDEASILSSCSMTTTSTYFSHQCVSIEGGFIFFSNEDDYLHAKMIRNHGMARSLPKGSQLRSKIENENPSVDSDFLFAVEGSNFRTSDLHAQFGLLDFKRASKYKAHRKAMGERYFRSLNLIKYYTPDIYSNVREYVAFCLPIFRRDDSMERVKRELNNNGIQTRPLIGSNLLVQPPFKKYLPDVQRYGGVPNAEWVHTHACYVGLPNNLTEKKLDNLAEILNSI